MKRTFDVPGRPVPKGRPRLNRQTGTIYTPKSTREYEAAVAWCCESAQVDLQPDRDYDIRIWFQVPDKRKADIDNLVKSVLDGMHQAYPAWGDHQVTHLEAWVLRVAPDKGLCIVEVSSNNVGDVAP